jgi:integrase
VRKDHGPRTPITAPYGTPEFEAQYHAAIRSEAVTEPSKGGNNGSLAWLIDRYKDTSAWTGQSRATQKKRSGIFKHVIASAGAEPLTAVTKKAIIAGRERRKATPGQANSFLSTMRALFKWAVKNDFVTEDPTSGVEFMDRPNRGGFPEGTEDQIAKFETRWPIGTRERLALTIFLETGLRLGDAAALGRQHVKDGMIILKTEKTGQEVNIPISPKLTDAMASAPRNGLALIAQVDGSPMKKQSLGNWFGDACKVAGVRFRAHGLRKAAAARLTDMGVTEAELEQIMGWAPGSGMARIYTKRRNSKTLAKHVAEKMKTESRTFYSQPNGKVGNEGKKR